MLLPDLLANEVIVCMDNNHYCNHNKISACSLSMHKKGDLIYSEPCKTNMGAMISYHFLFLLSKELCSLWLYHYLCLSSK